MVAHILRTTNPTARIIPVDPKENFPKQALFEEGWARHHPGRIERIGPEFGGDTFAVRPVCDPTPEKIASVATFISRTGEDAALRKATHEESPGRHAGITADMHG